MFLFYSISCLFVSFFSFIIGGYIYSKKKKSKENKLWGIAAFTVGFWSLSVWGVINSKNESTALIWMYLINASGIFIPVSFLLFTFEYTKNIGKKSIKTLVLISGILLEIIAVTPLFQNGVKSMMGFPYWNNPGKLYFLFFIFFILVFSYAFYILIKYYLKTKDTRKNQTLLICLSVGIGVLGGITDFFPQLFNIYPFGHFLIIFYIIGVAYAIIAYQLMDVKLILKRFTVYLISVLTILIPYAIILIYLRTISSKAIIIGSLSTLILFFPLYVIIKSFYAKIANKYFFSSIYDKHELLSHIDKELESPLVLDNICNLIYDALINNFRLKELAVLVWDNKNKKFVFKKVQKFTNLNLDSTIEKLAQIKSKEEMIKELNQEFSTKGVKIVSVFYNDNNLLGIAILGQKESEEEFIKEDHEIINNIEKKAESAINQILAYNEEKKRIAKEKSLFEQKSKELEQARENFRKTQERIEKLNLKVDSLLKKTSENYGHANLDIE